MSTGVGSVNTQTQPTGQSRADQQTKKPSPFSIYFSYLYLFGGFVSLIANLSKADVNIVLYAFLYVVMRHSPQLKPPFRLLLVFSIVIDVLWMIFVHLTAYDSAQFFKLVPWESGLRTWTFWMVVINLIIKSLIATVLFFFDSPTK